MASKFVRTPSLLTSSFTMLALLVYGACSPSPGRTGTSSSELPDGNASTGGTSTGGTGSSGTGGLVIHLGGSDAGGSGPVQNPVEIIETLPDGFTAADPEHPDTSKGGL